jgi:ribonuclease HI
MDNPYAMYVNCDGSMDYSPGNPGGIGFNISFPDCVGLSPIPISIGTYKGANIEMLEIEALLKAMEMTIEIWKEHGNQLAKVNRIIIITDRFGLRDEEKTSPYKIAVWRRNGWKNHEGKPIKNHKQLDQLDKVRKKLTQVSRRPVEIVYRRRKQNKVADRLAKAGKGAGLIINKLQKKGEKIGKRKYDGPEIVYKSVKSDMIMHINVFRKDPVQDEWEVWVEIISGDRSGCKLKIYANDTLAKKLKRGNEFIVKIRSVFRHHVSIYEEPEHVPNMNSKSTEDSSEPEQNLD